MIALALIVAGASLLVGLVVASTLRAAPTVGLQLAGLALLSVSVPLAAVLLSGWVMFHMGADTKILAVAAGSASASIAASLFLARSITRSIRQVSDASLRLAAGDLDSRTETRGPAEIAQLGDSFNAMAESIGQLFDARRELVAWASHDLRAPLASMQAMIEAIEDGIATPDQYLPTLRDQVRTLSSLVDDLFELARIDAGALTLELSDAPLEQVVADCVRGFEAQARSQRVRLEAKVAGSLPAARCAPEKVERVLFNLLTNALRYTPSDGSIAVLVTAGEETIEVAVEDTGTGLEPAAERRMFERFWRGDPSRSIDGAGLGLAIAQGLVEAQGGRIWAENRPGGGARVAFALPLAA